MITWMLAFLFFILIVAFGEIAANMYLTKLVHSPQFEDEITDSTVKEN